MVDSPVGSDPEAIYHWAGSLCEAGDHDGALGLLERSLDAGYYPASTLVSDPRFDPVRGSPTSIARATSRRNAEARRREFPRGGRAATAGVAAGVKTV